MAEQKEQIGEYRLLRQLGRGSFGTVYLAEHLHDHSQAAIKLLRFQLTSPKDLKDFLNEARTIRLRHPHIIPLFDFGLTRDDTLYLVMEYADGGTLRRHYPKGTRLPLETIDRYVMQLASALQYAHDRRVIHRDVKPENMLLRADGTILLSDFGIAKVLEQSTFMSLQTQVGTPAYMSPEQGQGKPCLASDQYSLAIIAYEWLAGRPPFQGAPLEVMLQHRVDAPPSLQALCPDMPIQVEQVVLQALVKTPEERFSSVQQFAQALHTALQKPSSTVQMSQQRTQSPVVPPAVVSSQSSASVLPSSMPAISKDQVVPPVQLDISPTQTVRPTDGVALPERRSDLPHPPEIQSPSPSHLNSHARLSTLSGRATPLQSSTSYHKKGISRHIVAIVLVVSIAITGSGITWLALSQLSGSGKQGTNGTTGSATLIGQVQSVNVSAHSVTLNVNGQQLMVNGLTDQQVALLQSQQGKRFSIQVTQAGTNTYTISTNTLPQETDNATPGVVNNAPEATNNNGVNEPGTIEFMGAVQNVSNGSITVGLPDGQGLSMNIVNGQTDEGDLNGAQLTIGQIVKATATANTSDGSFTASILVLAKPDQTQDQNTVLYQGVTTSAVGSDNKLNFKVGNKSFSYSIINGADLKDFNYSAQNVGNNFPVKVKVAFNNGIGTVLVVDNGNL